MPNRNRTKDYRTAKSDRSKRSMKKKRERNSKQRSRMPINLFNQTLPRRRHAKKSGTARKHRLKPKSELSKQILPRRSTKDIAKFWRRKKRLLANT